MNTKIIIVMGLMLTFVSPLLSQAQSVKDKFKQRKELLELNRDLQGEKVSKAARKQAKEMKKEGWKVAPGQLPLEQQLERAFLFQNMFEDDGLTPKYVSGDASSVAQNYDAGKMQALELALVNLTNSIETNITKIVESNRGNSQMEADNAASVVKTLSETKSYVTKRIGQTTPVIEVYRELKNGNVIVRVQTFYSMDDARKIAKEIIREKLEQEGKNLTGLDDLMGD